VVDARPNDELKTLSTRSWRSRRSEDRVVVGARPYDELKKIIDEELAKSPK
jgi:hypothetical protein